MKCDKCPCGLAKWCSGCTYPDCDKWEDEDEVK
jgi:hypothetical protein